jgi:two-component system sensor histidine kinase BaeS
MSRWWDNRLGQRLVVACLVVLAVALMTIVAAAQAMFISEHDLGLLMWVLVPAIVAAALAAIAVSYPVARDSRRLGDAAARVASGDLTARSGVERHDELGDAALRFDAMVERLAAVERERALMLSSISHDLRTPLAALRAAVEAIRDGLADDPDRYLTGMERQVRALALLVDDLQLHSRIVSGTLQLRVTDVDLAELADESLETVRPLAARHDVKLLLEASERVCVPGDPSQLGRVVRNLLDNAIRHAPKDSVVLVQVDRVGQYGRLRVVDEGDGFPPEFRQRAFEPFSRTDEARDVSTGTAGLGLSIARGIVAAHAGSVDLGDGPGGVVEITLPAAC